MKKRIYKAYFKRSELIIDIECFSMGRHYMTTDFKSPILYAVRSDTEVDTVNGQMRKIVFTDNPAELAVPNNDIIINIGYGIRKGLPKVTLYYYKKSFWVLANRMLSPSCYSCKSNGVTMKNCINQTSHPSKYMRRKMAVYQDKEYDIFSARMYRINVDPKCNRKIREKVKKHLSQTVV